MTELGCGRYRVLITDRCGGLTICDLTQSIDTLTYGRVLDDTTVADLVVSWGGAGCCECLGTIRTWIHGLAVYRDGELVFFGPVTIASIQPDKGHIQARDVTAWLDVRTIHNDYAFAGHEIVDIARTYFIDAMQPDDPCGLIESLTVVNVSAPPVLVDHGYFANTAYAGETMRQLARIGLDFTALGNRVVLGAPIEFGPFVTLRDQDFQVDLAVTEGGLEAATKWYVNGSTTPVAIQGSSGGIDPFYGLLERIASEPFITDVLTADSSAAARLVNSNPAPLSVDVPDGARLSPKAPVDFNTLVPGTLFRLDLRDLCREVTVVKRLTQVKVQVSNTLDEAVQLTLSPLGTGIDQARSSLTGIPGVVGRVE